MLARDLMTRDVETCTSENTLVDALAIMLRCDCGFVPVVTDPYSGVLEGIVTDRDIALFLGMSGSRAREVKIKECFNRSPRCVRPDTALHDIAQLMEEYQIHSIPVVDADRKVLGIISLKDLALEAWRERGNAKPELTQREIGEIVEAIYVGRLRKISRF